MLVETVLSSDKFRTRVTEALAGGFRFGLVFVTVRAAALNVARVADRVARAATTCRRTASSRAGCVRTRHSLVRRARDRGLLIDNTGGTRWASMGRSWLQRSGIAGWAGRSIGVTCIRS